MNLSKEISDWIKQYAKDNKRKTLVVGISGGIDSSVVSTLCAMTKMPTIAVSMPINQIEDQHDLSMDHGSWLEEKFNNVTHEVINLDKLYERFWLDTFNDYGSDHAFANTKSRLRMVTLHHISGAKQGIVVGTGNKVEDFGVGFYTKYGDGGVDISPIADCMKSDVYKMANYLNILEDIQDAPPTDGLWDDGRTDEDQIGMTYDDLEKCMRQDDMGTIVTIKKDLKKLETYKKIRKQNMHKMEPIPVCNMEKFR